MFQNLAKETSMPRRTLYGALFGMKKENVEESRMSIEWTWEKPSGTAFVNLLNDNKDVKFHRNFSSGTAVVRSAQPMSHDQYFWELKMISPVYGTDMMIGIGTSEADISQVHDRFISLLGSDQQSWGLSYTGLFHHNGESRGYSGRFGQGSVIGVHLDLWNGTLSFYKNKKHLGVASRGLTGKTLYAMASSTAACSGMRIIRSCSFPSSLQYLCCAKLRQLIPDDKHVLHAITFPPGLSQFLNNNLGWLMGPRLVECSAPSMPRNGLSFALRPDSSDPIMSNVHHDESEDEGEFAPVSRDEMVMLASNRPVILRGWNRRRPRGGILRVLANEGASRERGDQQESVSLREPTSLRESLGLRESMSFSVDTDRTFEMIDVDENEEEEDDGESEAKRQRSSYNYAMGLSDLEDNV